MRDRRFLTSVLSKIPIPISLLLDPKSAVVIGALWGYILELVALIRLVVFAGTAIFADDKTVSLLDLLTDTLISQRMRGKEKECVFFPFFLLKFVNFVLATLPQETLKTKIVPSMH